ncbi:MAG: hypothetical protein SFX74_05070 [Fimbriimonadaceae bacterium]|nr:hypothetical protein [Fimbriimonadaceae bacterium]
MTRFFKLSTEGSPKYAYVHNEYLLPTMLARSAVPPWPPLSYPNQELYALLEGGSKFPDFLSSVNFYLIVAPEVVSVLRENQIGNFADFSLDIRKSTNRLLRNSEFPPYRHLRVDGRVKLDLDAMHVRLEQDSSGQFVPRRAPGEKKRYLFQPNTWDGSDIFRDPIFGAVVFCTERVWELAVEHQWTNLQFTVPEDPFPGDGMPRRVEYRLNKGKRPPTPNEQAPLNDFALRYYAEHGEL